MSFELSSSRRPEMTSLLWLFILVDCTIRGLNDDVAGAFWPSDWAWERFTGYGT